MNPRYPIYILSKGRADSRLTVKALEKMNVPYRIFIEPCDYTDYVQYIDKKNIEVLPFENLGQGGIPARNFIWDYAIEHNTERHWIVDDNIDAFYRLNRGLRIRVTSGTIFRCAEDFTDRYENVALSGLNYRFFAVNPSQLPPYYLNTRIYSCILIKNDIPYRWRGRYNEDTDLSLRVMRDGYCTILFNAFLAGKIASMQMSGGNTDTVYTDGDERRKFAESLQEQHPEYVKVDRRYNRWHHVVDYTPFKRNVLIKKKGLIVPKGINTYGMILKEELGDVPDPLP